MNQEKREFLEERIELAYHKAREYEKLGDMEMAAYYNQAVNTMSYMALDE